jgi:T5SS/PEP-CTERM-associated repeat protein
MKIWVSTYLGGWILLSAIASIEAADSFWTNNAGGTFSTAGNWIGGVPGPGDNAHFTNDSGYTVTWTADAANANAFFNGNPTANRTIFQNIGSSTWLLTNSFVIDSQSANNIKVTHETGTLVVTNADGTASLVVGQNPSGSHTFRIGQTTVGATVIADRLFVTNGAANAILDLHNGTLTTLHGSIINYAGSTFVVDGQQADYLMTWNILGGSNTITSAQTTLGNNGGTHGVMLVSGPNTTLDNSSGLLLGNATARGDLTVSNGARVSLGGSMFLAHSGANGFAPVTGSNSILDVAGHIHLGWINSSGNTLTITDGAQVRNARGYIGYINGFSNTVLVSGNGSVWSNSLSINLGESGTATDNLLVVSNGARAVAAEGIRVAVDPASSGRIVVTGKDSLLQSLHGSLGLNVGSNSTSINATKGLGSVLLTDGGTYEGPSIISGFNGSGNITNAGGIFQFITPSPTITANTADSIVLTNGTISFRAIANATPSGLAGITYRGNNTLRLNNSTNATGLAAYTFDSVANTGNPTNYQKLSLMNGSTWRSTTLTIGSGGALVGNGTVAANVTNLGTIAPGFSAGQLTFTSNLVLGASSQLEMEIGGTGASDYDQLIVFGSVTVAGTLAVAPINGFTPTPGDTFTLIDNQGADPIFGEFDGLTNNAFLDASANGLDAYFFIQYDGGTGNDLVLIATIPEPNAMLLLLVTGGLLAWRRRKQ